MTEGRSVTVYHGVRVFSGAAAIAALGTRLPGLKNSRIVPFADNAESTAVPWAVLALISEKNKELERFRFPFSYHVG